jgi:hypothetical protein
MVSKLGKQGDRNVAEDVRNGQPKDFPVHGGKIRIEDAGCRS